MDQPDPPPAAPPPDPPSVELPVAAELPAPSPAPEEATVGEAENAAPLAEIQEPATPPPHDPATEQSHKNSSPFRLLTTVAVVFVSLFLFVRVFAVEPFGVPTGSMAPALVGNHREAPCPRCGYPVIVGAPNGS